MKCHRATNIPLTTHFIENLIAKLLSIENSIFAQLEIVSTFFETHLEQDN